MTAVSPGILNSLIMPFNSDQNLYSPYSVYSFMQTSRIAKTGIHSSNIHSGTADFFVVRQKWETPC